MRAFKKYFDYKMLICECWVLYAVLGGTTENYRKIIDKGIKLNMCELIWIFRKNG